MKNKKYHYMWYKTLPVGVFSSEIALNLKPNRLLLPLLFDIIRLKYTTYATK